LKQLSFDAHAQVTGWGSVNSTSGYQPEQLQVGRLEVLNHERCYQWEKQFFGKNLKPGVNFCAGGNQVNGTSKFKLIYISFPIQTFMAATGLKDGLSFL
jgi:hypothetical protein